MDELDPVTALTDLAVVYSQPVGGPARVEIIDRRRVAVELVSLTLHDAATLAGWLAARSVGPEADPGG